MASKTLRHKELNILAGMLEGVRNKLDAVHRDWLEQHRDKSERWRNSQPGTDEEIKIEELSDACDSLNAAVDSIRATMVMKG